VIDNIKYYKKGKGVKTDIIVGIKTVKTIEILSNCQDLIDKTVLS